MTMPEMSRKTRSGRSAPLSSRNVAYIVFSPRIETGWNLRFCKEAKEAGIPVIVTDRYIEAGDEGLYTAYIGSGLPQRRRKSRPMAGGTAGKAGQNGRHHTDRPYSGNASAPPHRSGGPPHWSRRSSGIQNWELWLRRKTAISRGPRLTKSWALY